MCASLLNKASTTLIGIPRIEEIQRIIEVFKSIGVVVERSNGTTLKITPPKRFSVSNIDVESAKSMRSVLMLIGALGHAKKTFTLPHAGGCRMGDNELFKEKVR